MDGTSDKLLRQLKFMRSHIAACNVLAKARRLQRLAIKAGFRPDQPRAPAGRPDGGQWIDEGGHPPDAVPRKWLAGGHPELPPEVPPEPPPTTKERNAWGVRVAKYLAATSPTLAGSVLVEWLVSHAGHRIRAYLEPAKSLAELQDAAQEAALNPKPGFDIHHIVEQTPARQDGFPEWRINAPENKVLVPTYRHWEITGWYQEKNKEFDGLSPREYLRNQPWAARRAVGLRALKIHGVLKP